MAITPEDMLSMLHSEGQDPDYNDGEEVDGWFGWSVVGDILNVTHESSVDNVFTEVAFRLTRI